MRAALIWISVAAVSFTQAHAQDTGRPAGANTSQSAPSQPAQPEGNFLGVRFIDLTKEEAANLGWTSPKGVKIVAAIAGGPAARAGLLPGDVAVSMDGRDIANHRDFLVQLRSKPPGAQISLQILRNKQISTIDIVPVSTSEALAEMERALAADPNSIAAHLAKAGL